MTVLFKVELRKPDENPKYIGTVKGVEAGVIGYYHEGKPYAPDRDAIEQALPACYRKAFQRSGGNFWFDTKDNATLTLCNPRHKVLATIWATPYDFKP